MPTVAILLMVALLLMSMWSGRSVECQERGRKKGARNSILALRNSIEFTLKQLRQLIKPLLKLLPQNDYPVLHSQLFVLLWIQFILDARVFTMRGLFFLLNHLSFKVDIFTFSKAFKHRSTELLQHILRELQQRLKRQNYGEFKHLFPLDSTIITLTSKLFWQQQVYQVKLSLGFDVNAGNIGDEIITFGQTND